MVYVNMTALVLAMERKPIEQVSHGWDAHEATPGVLRGIPRVTPCYAGQGVYVQHKPLRDVGCTLDIRA